MTIVKYMEKLRMQKGIKQKKAAEIIGCSESSYSNKVARNSFSPDEVIKILNELDCNLNNLKYVIMEDDEIRLMLEKLEYRGMENYSENLKGFIMLTNFLDDKILMSKLNSDIKFDCGSNSIEISRNRDCYGIDSSTEFFEENFKKDKLFDVDFMAGVFYSCFFKKRDDSLVYLFPSFRLLPQMLEYFLRVDYSNDQFKYILDVVDSKTNLSNGTNIFALQNDDVQMKYLKDEYKEDNSINAKADNFIRFIEKIIEDSNVKGLKRFELDKFVLKLKYIVDCWRK